MTPPTPGPLDRLARASDALLVVALAAMLGVALYGAIDWRITHDGPVMMYQAWLMDVQGRMPFRDIFDMNLPGSYLVYTTIGRVFGYGVLGLRLADMLLMAGLFGSFYALMRRFSWQSGLFAGALVVLRYLKYGADMSLQREVVALLPISLGVLAAVTRSSTVGRRSLLAGLAFGCAATIKPHAAIGLAPVVLYLAAEMWGEEQRWRQLGRGVLAGAVGFAAPLLVALGWIWANGLWDGFVHNLGYLPYYGSLGGDHVAREGAVRWSYILRKAAMLGGQRTWLYTAAAGLLYAWLHPAADAARRRVVALLGGVVAAYAIYPAGSGQFWEYHWLPMTLWTFAVMSLWATPWPTDGRGWMKVVPRVVAWWVVVEVFNPYRPMGTFLAQAHSIPKEGRPDRIAAFLKEHMEPGDTVQSLDWAAAGALHAMLIAEAPSATSFVYGFHFEHHVSTPYIQDLRERFLREFDAARPAFVIEGRRMKDRPWVWGHDTVKDWKGIKERLVDDYVPVDEGAWYVIWERREHAEARGVDARPIPEGAPNVLLMSVDTLRADHVGVGGASLPTTPWLDTFLAQGTWFEEAAAPVARTTPALASLLTGRYPKHSGVRTLFDRREAGVSTLAQLARREGFETFAVVSNHVVIPKRGLDAGFAVYDHSGDRRDAAGTTADALRHLAEADPERPVFAWVHYIDPHVPYHPDPATAELMDPGYEGRYAEHFGAVDGAVGKRAYPADLGKEKAVFVNELPDEVNEHVRALYAADVRDTDAALKTLIEGIRAQRGDDWIVVFTSDHGESLGEHDFFYDHGDYVYSAGLQVPLAFVDLRAPLPELRRVDGWVSLVDVAPTLVDLVGWEWPEGERPDGRSLAAALRGERMAHVPVYAESGKSFFSQHVRRRVVFDIAGRFRAAMLGRWKVILTPGLPEDEAWELYDLEADPGETVNVWDEHRDDSEVRRLVAALRLYLADDEVTPFAGAEAESSGAEEERDEPTAEDVELLKELGYME